MLFERLIAGVVIIGIVLWGGSLLATPHTRDPDMLADEPPPNEAPPPPDADGTDAPLAGAPAVNDVDDDHDGEDRDDEDREGEKGKRGKRKRD